MRLCIFATYDKNGIVDDYIPVLMQGLKQVSDYLIVVSNQVIKREYRARLEPADQIYERSDLGFDVGAFADVLNHLYGWEKVHQYDELILVNDFVFGPPYPFEEAFTKMDAQADLDFWGLVKRGVSDFDGGRLYLSRAYPTVFLCDSEQDAA